jgi:NAD dependent epimerase/dehydratase family enzyme
VGALLFLADHPEIEGPVNGTIPEPTRNRAWLAALGRVMHKPVVTHAPKWALRGAFGELADEIFLASVRAVPRKLLDGGYRFVDTDAEACFAWLLEEHERSSGPS